MLTEPTSFETIARLINDLRIGLPINYNGKAYIAVEHLTQERFETLQANKVPLKVAISANRALDLKLAHDPSRPTALEVPANYPIAKLRALADPSLDLDYPGKGPLNQSEYHDDINDILNFCRYSQTLPATLILPKEIPWANNFDISYLNTPNLKRVSAARVPLKLAKDTQLHVFHNQTNDQEHYAIIVNAPIQENPIVRVHSSCFTGDCLSSLKCDCGPQLEKSLSLLDKEGGLIIYLAQEGRGIGLANKMRAYSLQDQGYDTVEANHKLGFHDDERNFDIAAEILKELNIKKLRLLSNNPRKVKLLEESGIIVSECLPLKTPPTEENKKYLAVKAQKSGHNL